MAGVPIRFRSSNPFLINFDWTDAVTGLGIINFKGFVTENDDGGAGSFDYILGTQDLYSALIEYKVGITGNGSTYVAGTSLDFDTAQFVKPMTIKGTAYITCCIGALNDDSTDTKAKFKFEIIHYDGSTETTIGNETTAIAHDSGAGIEIMPACIKISCTETTFAVGDILRVTVTPYVDADNTKDGFAIIGTDPQNRDGSNLTAAGGGFTKLNFYCPFKTQE